MHQNPEWWSVALQCLQLLILPVLIWIGKQLKGLVRKEATTVAVGLLATHVKEETIAVEERHKENVKNFADIHKEIQDTRDHVEEFVEESNTRLLDKINGTYVRTGIWDQAHSELQRRVGHVEDKLERGRGR